MVTKALLWYRRLCFTKPKSFIKNEQMLGRANQGIEIKKIMLTGRPVLTGYGWSTMEASEFRISRYAADYL